MSVVDPLGGLQNIVESPIDGQAAALTNERSEIQAIDVLHDEKVRTLDFVGVVGGDDIGMAETGGRFDLALKPLQGPRQSDDLRRKHFERHQALHPRVLGLEHPSHTALAELIKDAIVSQHKIFAFALIDGLSLVGGDPFQLYQFASQLFSIMRAAIVGQAFDELPQLVCSQKLRVNDKTDESIYWHGHRASHQRLSNLPPTRSRL